MYIGGHLHEEATVGTEHKLQPRRTLGVTQEPA